VLPCQTESKNAIASHRTYQFRQNQGNRRPAEHDRVADEFLRGIFAGRPDVVQAQKHVGLESVFREVFPIESYDGKVVLDYDSYEIGAPKVDWLECLREGTDLWRAALRHVPAEGRGQERQGRKSFHGRTAADDAAGHVCHQWRGTRRRLAVAPLAGHRV
jgi:hypothetical protein